MTTTHTPQRPSAAAMVKLLENGESDLDSGCLNWTKAISDTGYGRVGKQYAHRLSYAGFFGPIPSGMLVLHKCDNRRCMEPHHLFLGSHADNSADMVAKGRSEPMRAAGRKNRGEKHHMVKLTWAIIRTIRASRKSGVSLAAEYGVCPSQITKIRLSKVWKENHT